MTNSKQFISVLLSVVVCVLVLGVMVYATTTIGNSITIGDTLTVTGTAYFNSTASMSDANGLMIGGGAKIFGGTASPSIDCTVGSIYIRAGQVENGTQAGSLYICTRANEWNQMYIPIENSAEP